MDWLLFVVVAPPPWGWPMLLSPPTVVGVGGDGVIPVPPPSPAAAAAAPHGFPPPIPVPLDPAAAADAAAVSAARSGVKGSGGGCGWMQGFMTTISYAWMASWKRPSRTKACPTLR